MKTLSYKKHPSGGSVRNLITCLVIFIAHIGAAEAAEKPLNVLWLMADDHAPYVCGAYGNAKAKTPNLDRLASEGMRFNQAYCNSPMCTASRQSFLTGRLPHSLGVTQLRTALGDEPVTLAELMKRGGRVTGAIGKMHFNRKPVPGLHGFDLIYGPGQAGAELRKRGARKVDPAIQVQPPWKPFRDHARTWLNAANVPQGFHTEDMTGTMFADRAVRFLKKNKARPFFLIASFQQPHSPFYYPVEYAGMFNPDDFEAPEIGEGDAWQVPEIFRDLTPAEIRGITAAYYTSTAFMDACVGKVLGALDELGLAKNTPRRLSGRSRLQPGSPRPDRKALFLPAIGSVAVDGALAGCRKTRFGERRDG